MNPERVNPERCACGKPVKARGLCSREYGQWLRNRLIEVAAPEPEDKVAYLASLTPGELAAYCTGVLSRASVDRNDDEEIAGWMDLVRLTSDRLAQNPE